MGIKKLIAPSNEMEIKKHWKYVDKIYISCVCFTFNQKEYIRDAIDSFLAQETEYRFEIIIHDDASMDDTPLILKKYQKMYPSIIKLILQKENQYSLKKQISTIAVSYSEGEYIALCEGDDFWTDSYKIQKQITGLLANPEVMLCFTAGYGLYDNGDYKDISLYSFEQEIINVSDVIRMGGAGMPTASLLMARDVIVNMPSWFQKAAPVGDYYMQIIGSMFGGALYLRDKTICYRINAKGSWSVANNNISSKAVLDHMNRQDFALKACLKDHFNKRDLDFSLATNKYNAALLLLRRKHFDSVKTIIIDSWCLYPNANKLQKLIYFFRRQSYIVYHLFRTRDVALKLFSYCRLYMFHKKRS